MPLTRPHLPRAAALGVLLGLGVLARPAIAQGDVGGSYDIVFTEVADNCDQEALSITRSQLSIETRRGDQLVVRLPGVPAMSGSERRGGQFRAEVRSDQSPIRDTRARYSVAGRVREGQIQLVFIAEFYRDDRPLCTQSFSGTGAAGEPDARSERAGRAWRVVENLYGALIVTPR